MENMDRKECGCEAGKCNCGPMGMGHMHCHGRYHLVRMILKIVIVILIFWCGFQLGKMTGVIRAGSGVRNNFGMVRGGYNLPVNGGATVVPVTPAQ